MYIDYRTASEEEIVEFCEQAQHNNCGAVHGYKFGHPLIKLSDQVVVKYGQGVTPQEASAQRFSWEKCDRRIVRVPRVYRFFTRKSGFWSVGYLIMEYVDGMTLDKMDKHALSESMPQISAAIQHINSIPGLYPGPIGGGEAHGILWSEVGSGRGFSSKNDLQGWLNERLAYCDGGKSIDISKAELYLCHMDLAPRNLMLDRRDGILYVLDWKTAGFYPRYFEMWSLEFAFHQSGETFFMDLCMKLPPPLKEDREMVDKLHLVYGIGQHLSL